MQKRREFGVCGWMETAFFDKLYGTLWKREKKLPETAKIAKPGGKKSDLTLPPVAVILILQKK